MNTGRGHNTRLHMQMNILRGCIMWPDAIYQKAMELSYIKMALSLYDQALKKIKKRKARL